MLSIRSLRLYLKTDSSAHQMGNSSQQEVPFIHTAILQEFFHKKTKTNKQKRFFHQ